GEASWKEMTDKYLISYALFFGNISLAKSITIISPITAPLWSVCIEEQFYLFWGILFRFTSNKNKLKSVLILTLLTSVTIRFIILISDYPYQTYYYFTFSHLDPIILGCLLSLLF